MMLNSTRLLILSTFIILHQMDGEWREFAIKRWSVNEIRESTEWSIPRNEPRRCIQTESHSNANIKNYSLSFWRDFYPVHWRSTERHMQSILTHIVVPLGMWYRFILAFGDTLWMQWRRQRCKRHYTLRNQISEWRSSSIGPLPLLWLVLAGCSQQNEKYEYD